MHAEIDTLVSLKDRAIVITGAARGIGRAAAELALDLGANVAAVDLDEEGLAGLAAANSAGRVLSFTGSVCDSSFVERSVGEVLARFGKIDGLLNNAGIVRAAMIEKMTLEQWNAVLDVHLTGSFLWLQAVGRTMLARAEAGEKNPGAIVNVSSDAGRRGTIGQINYAAAKAGIAGMTMAAAREWARHGIRTNTVSFGVVETPMTQTLRSDRFRDRVLGQIPLGRWGQPKEVVSMICFLLSDAASYIIGQNFSVNGGYHISS